MHDINALRELPKLIEWLWVVDHGKMRRGYSEVYLHLFVVIYEVVKDIYDER